MRQKIILKNLQERGKEASYSATSCPEFLMLSFERRKHCCDQQVEPSPKYESRKKKKNVFGDHPPSSWSKALEHLPVLSLSLAQFCPVILLRQTCHSKPRPQRRPSSGLLFCKPLMLRTLHNNFESKYLFNQYFCYQNKSLLEHYKNQKRPYPIIIARAICILIVSQCLELKKRLPFGRWMGQVQANGRNRGGEAQQQGWNSLAP